MFFLPIKVSLNRYNKRLNAAQIKKKKPSSVGEGKNHQGCVTHAQWQLKYQVKMNE